MFRAAAFFSPFCFPWCRALWGGVCSQPRKVVWTVFRSLVGGGAFMAQASSWRRCRVARLPPCTPARRVGGQSDSFAAKNINFHKKFTITNLHKKYCVTSTAHINIIKKAIYQITKAMRRL